MWQKDALSADMRSNLLAQQPRLIDKAGYHLAAM